MLSPGPRPAWRQGFALHRRRLEQDGTGETVAVYDMEHPDFVAQSGSDTAVCWQSLQSWQSSGRITSGWRLNRQGEEPSGALEGRLTYPLQIAPFDRVVLEQGVYEVRAIQRWPGHRKVLLQQIAGEVSA